MILCIFHQWLWSWMNDSDRSIPQCTRSHFMKCASCREKVAAMSVMEKALRRQTEIPPENWHVAVMAEIRRVQPSRKYSFSVMRPLPVALICMTAVIALVVYFYDAGSYLNAADESGDLLSDSMSVLEEVIASLETESAALGQDARNAARMATKCLPF